MASWRVCMRPDSVLTIKETTVQTGEPTHSLLFSEGVRNRESLHHSPEEVKDGTNAAGKYLFPVALVSKDPEPVVRPIVPEISCATNGRTVNGGFRNETCTYRVTLFAIARKLTNFLRYSKDLRCSRAIPSVEFTSRRLVKQTLNIRY